MSLFRLIRLPNLIIVALTQYLLYYKIILPILQKNAINPALQAQEFSLLVIITVLITAGGYIINDIIDLRIDRINKPERVIIGKYVAHQTAYWLYFCINISGFFMSIFLAFVANRTLLLFLFPGAVIGLLLYSARLKKQPLWGNLLVSFYCASVAIILWIAEQSTIEKLPESEAIIITKILSFYTIFAFFSTLFREIVKDMEDAHGDAQDQARTIPIAWGERIAKAIAVVSALLLFLSLVYAAFALRVNLNILGLVFIGLVGILIITSLLLLFKAKEKLQYHNLSQFAKIIMLCGILLLLFFK
ncbi:MAG: geranylgeranylglycerol-phosphate geranylgeranyltransferase [Saprospiraceae bacterium]|nr:geranylgeranylglycerol-phosphate geranylgeranyltransferase [Saprospiraceae bacterium]